MNGYEKQVKDILRAHGWKFCRPGKGSHEVWCKGSSTVSVNNQCKSRHTANEIMKAAGIRHKF